MIGSNTEKNTSSRGGLKHGYMNIIENAWNNNRDTLNNETQDAVNWVIKSLSDGTIRVAEKIDGDWQVNSWIKKAILLSFTMKKSRNLSHDNHVAWFDKLENKFANWTSEDFFRNKIRVCPPSHVREGSYIGEETVIMPSFVNIGAYVGKKCMIDTWATVGTCAQIGNNVHISGGAGIGGVLEPLGENPVIIEDNCFIGARSEIAEGVVVESGAVISMGVFIGASTKIVDRTNGKIYTGRVPQNAVVVPGSLQSDSLVDGKKCLSVYCAVIVKYADSQTRDKTSLNQHLRKHNGSPSSS